MDQTDGRQFVKYGFYKAELAWRRLPEQERLDHKRELAAVVDELSTHALVRSYSLVGLRADADFLLLAGVPTRSTPSRRRRRG